MSAHLSILQLCTVLRQISFSYRCKSRSTTAAHTFTIIKSEFASVDVRTWPGAGACLLGDRETFRARQAPGSRSSATKVFLQTTTGPGVLMSSKILAASTVAASPVLGPLNKEGGGEEGECDWG
jgi:hypothetical protein